MRVDAQKVLDSASGRLLKNIDSSGQHQIKNGAERMQGPNTFHNIEMCDNQRHRKLQSPDAVVIRHAHKSYNSNNPPVILGLNMTVQHGSMYGLLGSSGCGKTTILSCILGQQKLDSGEVRVFGHKPGTRRSGIPGRNVGYMPQDISLLAQFSLQETLVYFGRLVGMEDGDMQSRIKFLSKLLDLPNGTSIVSTLSGGQQRRVSLAVALIHRPRLLILDEPTVGVDPLLRHRIWEHLRELASSEQTTIIITTHYIEECRVADRIGVMGNGYLLTENSPVDLFRQFGLNTLESIVLLLFKQSSGMNAVSGVEATPCPMSQSFAIASNSDRPTESRSVVTGRRVLALARKNVTVQLRSPLLLLFVVVFPSVTLSAVGLSLGRDPGNLGLGIVNDEVRNHSSCENVPGECSLNALSCQFISSISADDFNLKWFTTKHAALQAITKGTIWGLVNFPPNISSAFVSMMNPHHSDSSEQARNASDIIIQLDESSTLVATKIKTSLHSSYEIFVSKLLSGCGYNPRIGKHSLEYRTPIFGTADTDFQDYLRQSVTPAIMFFYPIVTTSIRMIGDKRSGVISRSLVIGVTKWDIMTAYILSESIVSVLQVLLAYVVTILLFSVDILGSHLLVVSIYLLSSFGGMALGLVLASVCADELQASVIAMSMFLPTVFLSGVMWPVEGLSRWMQYVIQMYPCTLSGEAVRSVISRGWEVTHPNVWPGICVPLGYIFGLLVTAAFVLRAKGFQ